MEKKKKLRKAGPSCASGFCGNGKKVVTKFHDNNLNPVLLVPGFLSTKIEAEVDCKAIND